MNCLLIRPEELLSSGLATLQYKRALRAIELHRIKPGITIKAGVLGGKLGSATVLSATPTLIELSLDLTSDPPPRLPIAAIVAVPRPQTVKKVIHAATTIGIRELHFIRTENVEKSYLSSHSLEKIEIEDEILLALEQGCDTIAPSIHIHTRFKPFAQDTLPALLNSDWLQGAARLLAHTDPGRSSHSKGTLPAIIAIGPESGWNEFEVETFRGLDFLLTTLGPRMLRVEVAFTALLGGFLADRFQ